MFGPTAGRCQRDLRPAQPIGSLTLASTLWLGQRGFIRLLRSSLARTRRCKRLGSACFARGRAYGRQDVNSPTLLIANPDVVLLGMRAATGEEAIQSLHSKLAAQPGVVRNPPQLLVDLLERARMSSVCIAPDIALPHARTSAVDRLVLGIARTEAGASFDAEHPNVRLVFLVGTPKEALAEYLQMVAALSRLLRNPIARGALLGAPDEADFRALLAHAVTS